MILTTHIQQHVFKYSKILGLLCGVLISFTSLAQDAVFSQYYASGLYLNPALAGMQAELSLSTNYRIQWGNLNPYTTGQFSFIYPFLNKNNPTHEHWGGAGLSVYQDKAGEGHALQTTGTNANFAYNVNLGNEKVSLLAFGVQAGFIQQRINASDYEWGTKYTTGNNTIDATSTDKISTQKTYPDISAGVMWYFCNSKDQSVKQLSAYGGIAAYHLNAPNQSFIDGIVVRLPRLYKLNAGVEIPVTPKIGVSPNCIIVAQNTVFQINTGIRTNIRLKGKEEGLFAHPELSIGGWYRVGDAIIFTAGIATKSFNLGLSYDLNNSNLGKYAKSTSAYEISLAYKLHRGITLKHYNTPRM